MTDNFTFQSCERSLTLVPAGKRWFSFPSVRRGPLSCHPQRPRRGSTYCICLSRAGNGRHLDGFPGRIPPSPELAIFWGGSRVSSMSPQSPQITFCPGLSDLPFSSLCDGCLGAVRGPVSSGATAGRLGGSPALSLLRGTSEVPGDKLGKP